MKAVLLTITVVLSSFNAFAESANSDSGKIFNCLSWYRDTLSFRIKSANDISVFNQFSYQVTYTPSVWSRTETEDVGSFILANTLTAVSKSWDNVEQKWKYTKVPDTMITIEFKNNEPIMVTSSFMNLKCHQ